MGNNPETVAVSEDYLRALEETLLDYVRRYGLNDLSRLALDRKCREEPAASELEVWVQSDTRPFWTCRGLVPLL